MTIEAEIRDVLETEFGLDTSDLHNDRALFSSGLLDSLNSLRLLLALSDKYDLSVSPLDVSLEDFDTIGQIVATVNRLRS